MESANGDKAYNDVIYQGIKDTPKIDELSFTPTASYSEISKSERILPLVDDSQVVMVTGGYFGDEAKGKTVDAVADHPKIRAVARVNSGENAGHTVYHQGKKFVFNLTPSGIFTGKTNFIGPECVMDPITFMDGELKQLVGVIDFKSRLFVGNVQIVTPYHKLLDFMLSAVNSSTLKGMSPSHSCKVTKRGIRMDHLFGSKDVLASRLAKDLFTYQSTLSGKQMTEEQLLAEAEALNSDGNIRMPKHILDFITAKDKVQYLINLYDTYVVSNPNFPDRRDVSYEIRKILREGDKVLLEGPQSYWLSNSTEKFWESSTSADTSASGLQATARYNTAKYKHLNINVHKAPAASRVGIGANPSAYVAQDYYSRQKIVTLKQLGDSCADFDAIQREFHSAIHENGVVEPKVWKEGDVEFGLGVAMAIASSLKHGECGSTTKKPRVCGFFDCVLSFEVNEIQGPYTTISCMDRGDDYDKIGITIAYVFFNPKGETLQSNGRVYKNGDFIKSGDPVPCEAILKYCHPIVRLVDGWRNEPIAAGKRTPGAPLPKGVQEMVGVIEHFTGAEIISLGNGPHTEDMIYIQRK